MENKYLIIRLDEEQIAVTLGFAREIIPYRTPTPLPSMPSFLEGLVPLRGFFLPLIDLKKLLGITDRHTVNQKKMKIVVVSIAKKIIGIKTDDVEDIAAVNESSIVPPPALLATMETGYFTGGFYVKEKIILIIDIERLIREAVFPHKITTKELQY